MHLRYLSPLLLFAATVWSKIQSREDLYTRLVYYDKCCCRGTDKKPAIKTAWQQSWAVMDVIRNLHIDWNEAAALEFLGPPGFNAPYQNIIQQIINNLGTMNGNSIGLPLDWKINVRCDDWYHYCDGKTGAYTVSKGPRGMATIKSSDLASQVLKGKNTGDYRWKYDMQNYDNSKGEQLPWSRKKYCLSKY
jgi:hypothetical protein